MYILLFSPSTTDETRKSRHPCSYPRDVSHRTPSGVLEKEPVWANTTFCGVGKNTSCYQSLILQEIIISGLSS